MEFNTIFGFETIIGPHHICAKAKHSIGCLNKSKEHTTGSEVCAYLEYWTCEELVMETEREQEWDSSV